MENSVTSKLATAILAGAAIGGAAWYLLKTEHGRECWSAILDTAKNMNDKLKTSIAQKQDQLADLSDQASTFMSEKAHEAANFGDDQLQKINSKIESAQS
ncbi:hypothetical protein EIM50_26110 [Pseudoxanthomonas sp. SGD-10]|nr:hypothetical protein EIM50_26110 [Pseudoxanthomonas sp. SGD-10]